MTNDDGRPVDLDEFIRRVAEGLPLPVYLPHSNETSAVTITLPKTAALCYDRIWTCIFDEVPRDIGFMGATSIEKRVTYSKIIEQTFTELESRCGPECLEETLRGAKKAKEIFSKMLFGNIDPEAESGEAIHYLTRRVAESLFRNHGVTAVPLYSTRAARNTDYPAGDRTVIVSTIANVALVDENCLTWDQVREFRRDTEMINKFRRLTHWLEAEMIGKSPTFIEDEIGIRIEEYEAAIKKHGLKTALGTLEAVLDSRVLLGGAAAVAALSYATDSTWALFAGAAVLIGRAAVSIGKALLNASEIRSSYPEVAFVSEVRNRLARGAA